MKTTIGQLRRLICEEVQRTLVGPDMSNDVHQLASAWKIGLLRQHAAGLDKTLRPQMSAAIDDMEERVMKVISLIGEKMRYGDYMPSDDEDERRWHLGPVGAA
jgi:hypothetical protein